MVFNKMGFARYELEPFGIEDVRAFAQAWFTARGKSANESDQFLTRIDDARLGDLTRNPLLLTLAVLIFEQDRRHDLPRRRAGLYSRFVAMLVEDEEAKRGTRDAFLKSWYDRYGERGKREADRLFSQRRFLLENLAVWRQQGLTGDLIEEAIRFVGKLNTEPIQIDRLFLREQTLTLLERTGLVTTRTGGAEFIHDTFCEYLMATALTASILPTDMASWTAVISWKDSSWREVALFALGELSDDPPDAAEVTSELVKQSVDNGDLVFAGDALADGVSVNPDLKTRIVTGLIASCGQQSRWPTPTPFYVLEALHGEPGVLQGLCSLASESTVPPVARHQAALALERLGKKKEAASAQLELAGNSELAAIRIDAIAAIGRLRWSRAAQTLLDLAWDARSGNRFNTAEAVRCAAAVSLGRLGHVKDATLALVDVALDSEPKWQDRVRAINGLAELGRKRELRGLATGRSDIDVRIAAAEALGKVKATTARMELRLLFRLAKARPLKLLAVAHAMASLGLRQDAAKVAKVVQGLMDHKGTTQGSSSKLNCNWRKYLHCSGKTQMQHRFCDILYRLSLCRHPFGNMRFRLYALYLRTNWLSMHLKI